METYILRPATSKDAYEIWTVMDTCSKAMEHKDHFICDDLEYVQDILSGHGFAVAACDNTGKIVGNLLIKYPGLDIDNLGYDVFSSNCDIALTSENLKRVVHMDSASVLPQHRGHGLEHKMIAFAENLIDTSNYCYSFATVAPDNMASLKSLENNGYQIMITKEKYTGMMRCVMMMIFDIVQ